jgi:hypothetical protein
MSDGLRDSGVNRDDDFRSETGASPNARDLLRLFAAACDDILTDEEAIHFAELLESHPTVQQRYIEYMHLDTNLRYELAASAPDEPAHGSSANAAIGFSLFGMPDSSGSAAPIQSPLDRSQDSASGLLDSFRQIVGSWIPVAYRSTAFGMLMCAALGALAATLIVGPPNKRGASEPGGVPGGADVARQSRPDAESYVATLVNATNCRWDKTRSTIDFQGGGGLKPGQSLHLLEGVAQVNSKLPSGAVAEFQLEGPLSLMLNSEGLPNLSFGRLTGSFRSDYDRFTLDTPLGGRVMVSGDASIGIVAAVNDVELHVFSGTAIFEYWTNGDQSFPDQLKVVAGTSLRARVASDNSLVIEHGKAKDTRFASTTAADSQLVIPEAYVQAIRKAKPVGYWRFESDEGGLFRNEMADKLHCRIVGESIRLNPGAGNRTAEFGATDGHGYMYSDDVIDEVGDSYATEAWVKPSYYHHATLFSLVEPKDSLPQQHRFLLELCGPGPGQPTTRPWEMHPNEFRYLHRGTNRRGPSQCYSAAAYTLRKWQHVVIVKDKTEMQLYVDGEHLGSAKDRVPLGNRLHVIMGQLYPKDAHGRDVMTARQFVGQLDEVAFYDRALTQEEIRQHFHAARPEMETTNPDS